MSEHHTQFASCDGIQIVGNYVSSSLGNFANIAKGGAEAVGNPNSGINFQKGTSLSIGTIA